jgi:tetratricopeptide (TPR) repeat protein
VCGLALAQTVPPSTDPASAPPAAAPTRAAEHEITPAETEAARASAPAATSAPAEPAAPKPAEATPEPDTGDKATAADRAVPGADTPSASTAEPGVAQPSRSDAYAEFRRLFDDRQYKQALVPAQQVVTLSQQQGAEDDLQVALMNLAATQSLAEDYVSAEATYLHVIELIDAAGTRASSRLARANAGLAVVYHDAGRHELAVTRFEHALALARRTEGLFDEAQLPLIDKFTDSLTATQNLERAHDAQRYGLRIVERKYGENAPEIVPRLETLARWYTRVGAYDAARMTLRRAITIVERGLGENSVELIGPLTALAENYRRPLLNPAERGYATDPNPANAYNTIPGAQDGSMWRMPSALAAEGERALERALEIAESQPQPAPARIADVRTQLGDWYQTRLQHDKALPHYLAAWSAARQVHTKGDATLADALFARPVLLHYVRPSEWDRFERRPPDEVSPHTVEIELTVTAEGRVRDAEVIANDGSARMAEATLDAAETARYRPRFIDGKPLDTADVRFAQTYFEPIPVETPPAETKSDTPGQAGGA